MEVDKKRLLEITETLKKQYRDKKAVSLNQVKAEHPEISFVYLNNWANQYFGQTAKVYLVEQGIIEATKRKTEEEKFEAAKQGLRNVMYALSQKYRNNKAKSFTQVMGENTNLPISSINAWTRRLFDTSAKKYLEEQGIIETLEDGQLHFSFSNINDESTIEKKLQVLTDTLKEIYSGKPAESLVQIKRENNISNFDYLNSWANRVYGLTAKEYLIKEGVIVERVECTDDEKKLYVLHDLDPNKFSEVAIDSLSFSNRTTKCLERANILNLNEVLRLSMNDLKQLHGFGAACKNEINTFLSSLNTTEDFPSLKNIENGIVSIDSQEELHTQYNIDPTRCTDIKIEKIGLSVRTYNCLKRAQIVTLADLLHHSIEQIEEIRGFGATCKNEILQLLSNIKSNDNFLSAKLDKDYVKKIIKENRDEILKGNFACEAFSTMDEAGLAYIESYREAYVTLGEDAMSIFSNDTQQMIYLMQITSLIAANISKQSENEKIVKKYYNAIPEYRKKLPLKIFIDGYAKAKGTDDFINKLMLLEDNLLLGESKGKVVSLATKLDTFSLEKFLNWCVYDYEISLNTLVNEIKLKDRWATVIEGRASGLTLEEVGRQINLTRERVRQIENKVKFNFVKWEQKENLLYHIFSDRNGDGVLTPVELKAYLGEHYDLIIYLLRRTSELYDADLDVFIIGETIGVEETQTYIDNLPDILNEEQYDLVIQHGIIKKQLERELLDKLLSQEYTLYGKIYSRKKLSLGSLYQDVLKKYFPQGMRVYESEELNKFRQIIKKEYGRELSANDRALAGRLIGIGVLAGRGIYKAKRERYISEELKDNIYNYIIENPAPMLSTSGIFNQFEEKLITEGIDNRYFLHGILGELFDDEFSFKRDYVCKDEAATSMYEEIITFIEQHEYPVSKNEIMEHFPGVTSIVVLLATEDEKILNLFGEYIHVNRLKIYDDDVQYLKTMTETALEDGDPHHVKVIYEKILNDNKSLVERLNLEQAFGLFSLLQYLFGNDFEMSRPYLAKKGSVIGRIPEQINEIFANSEEVVLNDVLDFAKDNHYVIYSIIDFILEHTNTHILANKDLMISAENSGLTEAHFKQIEKMIYNEVEGTMPIANLRCIHEFEKINIPWNEWVVFTATYKWASLLEISTIGNQFRTAIPVISRKGEMDVESLQGISNTGTFVVADDLENIDELLLEDLDFEFGELD